MICELFSVPADSARQVLDDPSGVHDLLQSLEEAGAIISLEKSWQGLHFALTGSAWGGEPPLNFLAAGGKPVGDEDVGYGPARILDPDQVDVLNSALVDVTEAEFARRFDLAELAREEVYPQIWDEPLEDLLEEYRGYLAQAKALIGQASREGHALLIVIR